MVLVIVILMLLAAVALAVVAENRVRHARMARDGDPFDRALQPPSRPRLTAEQRRRVEIAAEEYETHP